MRRELTGKVEAVIFAIDDKNSMAAVAILNNSSSVFKDSSSNAMSVRSKDPLKETPENDNQSPEVTSKAATIDNEAKESPNKFKEKLSAALVNVPNEQHVGATERNVDQYGDANEQASDEQDLGAAERNVNQHKDINEQNHDQDEAPLMVRQKLINCQFLISIKKRKKLMSQKDHYLSVATDEESVASDVESDATDVESVAIDVETIITNVESVTTDMESDGIH
ncbi:hypothetical protein CQW23_23679 [Capsicum baccatum]|uniref:Uncharacterized protein n=1 Tax=Capsicum baccatum TaxID=33114 RepID=A0A2G2VSL8_CAPBA|nr:hypothetical protein CQW23_23679 [Capsicum baccatum]